jgi:hypothetical protein
VGDVGHDRAAQSGIGDGAAISPSRDSDPTAGALSPDAGDAGSAPRADTLAYPSPTTARFVLLVLALLAGGLYIGTWVYNLLVGADWFEEAARCLASAPAGAGPLEQQQANEACMASVERRRAGYAFAGGAATLAAGLLTLALVPAVIERRRGLRPLPQAMAATRTRADELAREAGLRRPPELMLGRSSQRDAFSYGFPGRYRIALPPKAALRPRDAAIFDPLLRHELAHIAHHDVALAWLARSVWWAFVPLLLVPVVLSTAQQDLSVTFDYVWRATVVLVTVRLVADALLRVREHDADLAAGRGEDNRQRLRAILSAIRSRRPHDERRSFMRTLRAQHPTATRRLEVLDDPTSAVHPTPLDALTASFLAATAAPLIESTASTALTASGRITLSGVIAAAVSGSLLGVAVGLGMWRAALYHRLSGRPLRLAPVALSVGAGLVLGRALSLGQVGTASGLGADHPGVLVVPALAGVGATAVVTGLALLWADAAPRMPSARRHWLPALLTSGMVFAAAVWTSEAMANTLDYGGVAFAALALVADDPSWLTLSTAVVVALAAAVPLALRRPGLAAPSWTLEAGGRPLWPVPRRPGLPQGLALGILTGAAGTATYVGFRTWYGAAGSAGETEARVFAYILLAGLVAAAAVAAAGLLQGSRGAATALVAAPTSVLTTALGFAVLNVALGGTLTSDFARPLVLRPLSITLMLALLGAGTALVLPSVRSAPDLPAASPGAHRESSSASGIRGRASGTAVLAVVLSVALAGGALSLRHGVATADRAVATRNAVLEERLLAQAYVDDVVVPMANRFEALGQRALAIDADRSLAPRARGRQIRTEVLPGFREMLASAEAYRAPSPGLKDAHKLLVDAVRWFAAGTETLALALERQDAAAAGQAQDLLARGVDRRTEWLAAVAELSGS